MGALLMLRNTAEAMAWNTTDGQAKNLVRMVHAALAEGASVEKTLDVFCFGLLKGALGEVEAIRLMDELFDGDLEKPRRG